MSASDKGTASPRMPPPTAAPEARALDNDRVLDASAVQPELTAEMQANLLANQDNILTAHNMEQLIQQQEMEAAEDDGLEMLRNVFDSMATNGKITMDQLPFVLVGAEVQATAQEIEQAIEEHIPDSDDTEALLDFHQVQCLYQQLSHNAVDMQLGNAPELAEDKSNFWTRLWRRFKNHRQLHKNDGNRTAYERHMKPTTRLLLMILACACTMCIAVVVFSICYIWIHASNTMMAHMARSCVLVRDGMYLFGYEHPFENYNSNMERQAMLLGVIVEHLGYKDTMTALKDMMVYEQRLLIDFLDSWFSEDSMNTVGTNAMLARGWLENLHLRRGQERAIAMVDLVNERLPPGHELLVGRWDPVNRSIELFCIPRYADQCAGGNCIIANEAMLAAVLGQTGTMFTTDYRPHPVVAGFTYLNVSNLGLVYKVDREGFQAEFLEPMRNIVDEINLKSGETVRTGTNALDRQNSQEVVLARQVEGDMEIVSVLRDCDAKCLQSADVQGNVMKQAFTGTIGVNETTDFNGEEVIMAYGLFEYAGLALSIKTAREEFFDGVYVGLGDALNAVNDVMHDTKEVQFAVVSKTQSNSSTQETQSMNFYSHFRFPEECNGDCASAAGSSAFMRKALVDCEWGSMSSDDYRDKPVTAGYACVPLLNGGLVMKVDNEQVIAEGTALVGTIGTYENEVRYKDQSAEVAVAKLKPGVTVVTDPVNDIDRITEQRFAHHCPNRICTGSDVLMQEALKGLSGTITGPDYRDTAVLGAFNYIPGLEVGVVIKMDTTEANSNTVDMALQLAGCAIAAVLVSMVLLALLANILLKTMDRTWDEGKKAIEREKEQLCSVITAMYPPQVAKRMLAGETQIVYNVGSATVFFSDIYEFTAASNTITPEQLIQFLGYTFGLMDIMADHYRVHKVKTIGDAYLGVAGLPGTDSLHGSSTLDMLLFATCCAQIFGQRFLHPDEGAILDTVAHNLFTKKKPIKTPYGPEATYAPKGAAMPNHDVAVPEVHCTMRYGVSVGPITAGVLQGKTPLFDIWGRTVNLASRMESTGQPGRIQVAEGVYQTVASLKGQPFTFEARHKVFCKGFGNVSAYFVNTCSMAPPKDLLIRMHIEPNFGNFFFDNPVPGFKAGSKGAVSSNQQSSKSSSHQGPQSVHSSSEVSGTHVRADAVLRS